MGSSGKLKYLQKSFYLMTLMTNKLYGIINLGSSGKLKYLQKCFYLMTLMTNKLYRIINLGSSGQLKCFFNLIKNPFRQPLDFKEEVKK